MADELAAAPPEAAARPTDCLPPSSRSLALSSSEKRLRLGLPPGSTLGTTLFRFFAAALWGALPEGEAGRGATVLGRKPSSAPSPPASATAPLLSLSGPTPASSSAPALSGTPRPDGLTAPALPSCSWRPPAVPPPAVLGARLSLEDAPRRRDDPAFLDGNAGGGFGGRPSLSDDLRTGVTGAGRGFRGPTEEACEEREDATDADRDREDRDGDMGHDWIMR